MTLLRSGLACTRKVKIPSAHPEMSSTAVRPQMQPQNITAVSATMSSENLGSSIHTAHDSTTSVPGYDSASIVFHRDTSSNAQPIRMEGSSKSELNKDLEMEQDVTHERDTEMDTIHQDEYKIHDRSQSSTQPDQQSQSSTGTDRTAQLVAQLLKAQSEGTLNDVTGVLHGVQVDELAKIKLLAQFVSETTDSDWPNQHPTADTGTDSDLGSQSYSGDVTDGDTTEASNPNGSL